MKRTIYLLKIEDFMSMRMKTANWLLLFLVLMNAKTISQKNLNYLIIKILIMIFLMIKTSMLLNLLKKMIMAIFGMTLHLKMEERKKLN